MIDFQTYKLQPDDHVLVVSLSGQLDTDSCEYLFSCLETEIENGCVNMIVDCRDLTFVSSMGLATLIRVHSRMKKHGGNVKLARVQGTVATVIHTVQLDRLLHIFPTVREARAAFV